MNICIAHGGDLGDPRGCTNRIVAFVKALRANGFRVKLVVPEPSGEVPEILRDTGIFTVPVKAKRGLINKPGKTIFISSKAKKIAKASNAYLQIENAPIAGFTALEGFSGYILSIHDLAYSDVRYGSSILTLLFRRFLYKLERKGVQHASKIIVPSGPMKDVVVNEWGVPPDDITVIPNGYFEEKMSKFSGLNKIEGRVTFLGSLNPHLDLETIIQVGRLPEVKELYIIGDGEMRRKLENTVKRLNLRKVVIKGIVPEDEAFNIVASSELAINPKKDSLTMQTSSPLKLFEYSALGTASIMTQETEIYREFKKKKATIVAKNREEFIKEVKRLLGDREERVKLASNAKDLVKKYAWEEIAKRHPLINKGTE